MGNSQSATSRTSTRTSLPTSTDPLPFLIPEKHLTRYLSKQNGESALISKFANAGFRVIDPAVYATVRKGARFEEALKNHQDFGFGSCQ